MSKTNKDMPKTAMAEPTPTATPAMSMEDEKMKKHLEEMNDGRTVMAMMGKMNPEVLNVTKGQSLRFVNHESYSNSIVADNAEFKSLTTASGAETEFKAPMKTGTYKYSSKIKPEISGTLVVEE